MYISVRKVESSDPTAQRLPSEWSLVVLYSPRKSINPIHLINMAPNY